MKILFKYPTMGRPEWFKKTFETYWDNLSDLLHYEFLITMNSDDPTMNNDEIKKYLDGFPYTKYFYGEHQNKVEAINADMDEVVFDFDVLFLISDDMIPTFAFDIAIKEDMEKHFPKMDGVLHYNDGCCGKDRCITLSIMGRKLYEQFGYVYHPDYNSFFCDNEFTDVVYQKGKVVYIDKVLVKHEWQSNGGDEVYRNNSRKGKDDEVTYKRRKREGFPK